MGLSAGDVRMLMTSRTVHSLLWYKRFISETVENTLILCGNQEANASIFPMCLDKAYADGTLFWLPYPGMGGASGFEFSNFVIDSSWDKDNLSQDQEHWFEQFVMPQISLHAQIYHAP